MGVGAQLSPRSPGMAAALQPHAVCKQGVNSLGRTGTLLEGRADQLHPLHCLPSG